MSNRLDFENDPVRIGNIERMPIDFIQLKLENIERLLKNESLYFPYSTNSSHGEHSRIVEILVNEFEKVNRILANCIKGDDYRDARRIARKSMDEREWSKLERLMDNIEMYSNFSRDVKRIIDTENYGTLNNGLSKREKQGEIISTAFTYNIECYNNGDEKNTEISISVRKPLDPIHLDANILEKYRDSVLDEVMDNE